MICKDKLYCVKFIDKEEHNIVKGCPNIQLQTLENCISLEGNRKDLDESNLTSYIAPGVYKDRPLEIPGLKMGGKKGFIHVGGAMRSTESFNILLYCMSILKGEDITLKFGKSRFGNRISDFFCFPLEYSEIFARIIVMQLSQQLKVDRFINSSRKIIEENGGMDRVFIQTICEPVKYYDQKDLEVSQRLPNIQNRIKRLVFGKRKEPFEGDKEFRFTWLPIILKENKPIQLMVKKDPILIKSPTIPFE